MHGNLGIFPQKLSTYDHHVVLCWLVKCTVIWVSFLPSFRSDCHVVLRWLMQCTVVWVSFLPSLRSDRPVVESWVVEGTVIRVWFQHIIGHRFFLSFFFRSFRMLRYIHRYITFDCSWYLSSSMNMRYCLFWKLCSGSSSLSLRCYAAAFRKNMVATLLVFRTEY